MNFLLDTQIFLWLATEPEKLSKNVLALMESHENKLLFSSISVWEIAQKHQRGKLPLPATPQIVTETFCESYKITLLPFAETAAFLLPKLPPIHSDPFDRMLICQALEHGLTFITSDTIIHQYPVSTLW